jgi:hypothetical protein
MGVKPRVHKNREFDRSHQHENPEEKRDSPHYGNQVRFEEQPTIARSARPSM